MTRRAFTLIELLVVTAIIAILSAILFPVFAQSKNAAKRTKSLNNMKQIGVASVLYLGDYDDVTPPIYYVDCNDTRFPTAAGFFYWGLLLLPYTRSEQVLLCPADTADDPTLSVDGYGRFDMRNPYHLLIVGANSSYGYNAFYLSARIMSPDPNGTNPMPYHFVGRNASEIARPAGTVAFAEATMMGLTSSTTHELVQNPVGYARFYPPCGPTNGVCDRRYAWSGPADKPHSTGQIWSRFDKDKTIVAWLDGHVKVTSRLGLKGEGADPASMDRNFNGVGE